MKISDFIYGLNMPKRTYDAIARVRVFVNKNLEIYAVITDLLDKRTGLSVSQLIEHYRQSLIDDGFVPETAQFVEHYDEYESPLNNKFYMVSFDSANHPSWHSINIEDLCDRLDCLALEFSTESLAIPRIYQQVEKIRHDFNPFLDEPYIEKNEVLIRRENIKKNQVSHSQLKLAIENNASESELHRLIQSDLSILGDYFSNPKEFYICFSEFEIVNNGKKGRIDFVVFTGSSRMDVILIEIKGANYNLITTGSYQNFSAKTNEAVQQLRDRTSCVYREYNHYRKYFHKIRKKAEKGKTVFHSFVGPQGKLLVDPRKDIIVHRVCIGGRSKDDIAESRLRHDYEHGQSPSIKIESWDSFLNKLQRD